MAFWVRAFFETFEKQAALITCTTLVRSVVEVEKLRNHATNFVVSTKYCYVPGGFSLICRVDISDPHSQFYSEITIDDR